MTASTHEHAPLRVDLAASVLLGLLAGLFATVMAANLGLAGKRVFGLTVSVYLLCGLLMLICLVGIIVTRFLSRYVPPLYSFGKFAEVGGLNWLFDLGVLNLLILVTGRSTGVCFALFKGISFTSAATSSYFWNSLWVFGGHKKQGAGREVRRFSLATASGLVVNVGLAAGLLALGPRTISAIDSRVWANMAGVAGSLGGMLFNFALYKAWVFKDR